MTESKGPCRTSFLSNALDEVMIATAGIAIEIVARTLVHPSTVWMIAFQAGVLDAGPRRRNPSPTHTVRIRCTRFVVSTSAKSAYTFMLLALVHASRRV